MLTLILLLLLHLLGDLVNVYMLLIVIFALMSWLPGAYESKLGQLIGKLVIPFQRCFDFATIGMISFAPLLALIILYILERALMSWIPIILIRIFL